MNINFFFIPIELDKTAVIAIGTGIGRLNLHAFSITIKSLKI